MAQKVKDNSPLLSNRTIIIGCGNLGSAIAYERWQQRRNVIILDSDPQAFLSLSKDFTGDTVIADALDLAKLEEIGIASADEVVVATGDDTVNIYLAHVLTQKYCFGIDFYVRLSDADLGVLLDDLHVNPIYPFQLSFSKYQSYKANKGGKNNEK